MNSNEWMSLEEAIEHVMKAERCSREVAHRKLVELAKAKKLPIKITPRSKSPYEALPPLEAVKRFDDDPASVLISLQYFLTHCDFTPKELLGELQSGRLRAYGSEATTFKMRIGERTHPAEFVIDGQALINWISNPKTPQHLVAKFNRVRKTQ